ncbi:MAG: sugar O-acetyltransferase [Isosphaeraceae bacterium]
MKGKTEKQRMLSGEPYLASDPELVAERLKARRLTRLYNRSQEGDAGGRSKLLRALFRQAGERVEIEPPFRCDYGSNIAVGDGFYANFDCIILDCHAVTIGREVKLGPRVQILAAYHPTDPGVRASGHELSAPVTIDDGVWIGAGAIICPGVRIGPGTTVGAGSVVTRDLPGGVLAVGVPCRVVRELP